MGLREKFNTKLANMITSMTAKRENAEQRLAEKDKSKKK